MATETAPFQLLFPDGFDALWEAEMSVKGFIEDVVVRTEAGFTYRLNFIDLVRLQEDLSIEAGRGRPYFAEPGLIVVPEVTVHSIEAAVERLWREDYFAAITPVDGAVPHPFRLIEEAQALLSRSIGPEERDAPVLVEEAMRRFEEAGNLSRATHRSACLLGGNCAEHLGHQERARQFYDEVLRDDPYDTEALARRGRMTFESDRESAIHDLEKAAANPTLLFPRYYLAYDAIDRGNYRKGLRLCEEALVITSPEDARADLLPEIRADLLDWAASVRVSLGATADEVRPYLEQALELVPRNEDIKQHLAARNGWTVRYTVNPRRAGQLPRAA